VRNADKLRRVEALHGLSPVDHVVGDVTDATAVGSLLAGCDAVIHAAAVAALGPSAADLIERTNLPATELVLGRAAELGLDPIVHVSSQSTLHPPPNGIYRNDDPLTPQPVGAYGRSKVECERVARRLQDDGHPVVIVWPSGIVGPDDIGLSIAAGGTARLLRTNVVPFPRGGGILFNDVRDLAEVLVRCLEPGRGPRRFGVFGHFLDWGEMHELLVRVTGRNLKVMRLPDRVYDVLGALCEQVGRLGIEVPLDSATATFMTTLVPGDDEPTRSALDLEWRPADETYADLIRWLVAAEHLPASKAPALV
jgi:nucleoside-diphosphate-sugar epimerase